MKDCENFLAKCLQQRPFFRFRHRFFSYWKIMEAESFTVRVCERSAAMKAPAGLLSDRTVLPQARWRGLTPTSSRLRAQRSNESPSGAFKRQNGLAQQDGGTPPRQVRRCFSLTNAPPVCYLYSIETAHLLTERCGAPQCSCAGRVNADRLGSLAQLLRKAAFFAIKEDV